MGAAGLKRYVWRRLAGAYHWSGVSRARHKGTVAILNYHRVLSAEDLDAGIVQSGMYVRDEVFRMHMEYLRERFEVLSLSELLDRWRTGRWKADTAACVITFDDGWLDNYRHAYPILRRYRLPATIFLPTDFVGTSRWFWPERLGYLLRTADAPSCAPERRTAFYQALTEALQTQERGSVFPWDVAAGPDSYDRFIEACKELEAGRLERLLASLSEILGITVPETRVVMNWDEVREMSQHDISFGSHSCSHRLMTLIPEKEVRQEVNSSYERLRESGAATVPVFCYPNGNYNDLVQQIVREAGYQAAASCDPGLERETPVNLMALRRISIHHDISESPALLALALSALR
ncbi:Polysaccharide deacetylase [Nitrospira tepida]|uniref:Polysaccharide deacetylase n=1 Tax=Nitrospira tepida TaxID=2973512 RepID=A0AA86N0M8_9BACT|nr:polysaccharide deacetylase family protein [Nitrospira tepida]CAI4032548.1 Polysaccharide deacetylase [Nitrospira tepida]